MCLAGALGTTLCTAEQEGEELRRWGASYLEKTEEDGMLINRPSVFVAN